MRPIRQKEWNTTGIRDISVSLELNDQCIRKAYLASGLAERILEILSSINSKEGIEIILSS